MTVTRVQLNYRCSRLFVHVPPLYGVRHNSQLAHIAEVGQVIESPGHKCYISSGRKISSLNKAGETMCAAPMPATIYAILDAVSNLRTPVSWFRHVAAKLANCCISFHEKNLFHQKKKTK